MKVGQGEAGQGELINKIRNVMNPMQQTGQNQIMQMWTPPLQPS